MQRDLRTIRDLNKEHLDLLKSIRDNSYASIEKQFGLPKSQVKAFFHYFPTYYHLHVHFVHVKIFDKAGVMAGKAVFLEDVIENIEKFDPNFYQKKTLLSYIGSETQLFKLFKDNNAI